MYARHTMLILLCVPVFALSSACVDAVSPASTPSNPNSPAAVVRTVTLSPSEATLATGAHLTVHATPIGADGNPATVPVLWSTSDSAVATVSPTGEVVAIAPGKAVIMASASGTHATAPFTITAPAQAESVTVAPMSAQVMVAQTVQFAATVADSAAQGVAWGSSNDQVASVSPAGLVTGVSAGSATIRATYQGRMATATVTVLESTPATPPPGDTTSPPADSSGTSVLWAHEPSGFSALVSQPWNAITALGWQEYDVDNHVTVVADPTVPTGDPEVLQFLFPEGFSGLGYGPGLVYYMMSKSEMYLGFYWKMSPDWEGHTSNVNKMFYLFQREGDNREAVLVVAYGRPGGPYHLEISNEASDGGRWWTQNVNNVTLVPGQWYKMEMHLKKSSADAAPDGLVEWWINGQLAARYTDAKLRGANFSEVHIDPVWGGTDSTISKTHDDYQRFGRFYISGR